MKKSTKYIILGLLVLAILFLATFMVTNTYLKGKKENNTEQSEEVTSNKNYLANDVVVILNNNGIKVEEKTIEDIKVEENLEEAITLSTLKSILSERGYKYETQINSYKTLYFEKENKSVYTPNKYYIGVKDDYVAIYRSDDKGNLNIEDAEKDIFKDKGQVHSFPSNIQELLKNYKTSFDTKEDAIFELSGLF